MNSSALPFPTSVHKWVSAQFAVTVRLDVGPVCGFDRVASSVLSTCDIWSNLLVLGCDVVENISLTFVWKSADFDEWTDSREEIVCSSASSFAVVTWADIIQGNNRS